HNGKRVPAKNVSTPTLKSATTQDEFV
ncbi:hypothetical protein A2U01_0097522, partial [Trifolium medium]|nr:hypothetical protein [Trifolium medium]